MNHILTTLPIFHLKTMLVAFPLTLKTKKDELSLS